ncbi:MAG TPA: adenylate kinase [candidate division Zixibacteria bacterium]|nr:adenylate kinase [candidate division Zixibacteria bacterium]
MLLVMLGPPGSGKGTQASRLAERLDLHHLSTGDMLRSAVKNETELGKKAKEYMDKGDLVPDSLILDMIRETIKNDQGAGFIFDGFPRTIPQAEGLDRMLQSESEALDGALNLEVSDQEVIKRLSGRYFCPQCQRTYNYPSNLPKKEGICDECGVELQKRKDDSEDVVRNRLEVYKKQTQPLIDYYKDKSILVNVDGERDIGVIFNDLVTITQSL